MNAESDRRRWMVLFSSAAAQCVCFFLVSAIMRPSGEVEAATVAWWAVWLSLGFAAIGFGVVFALPQDLRRMEVVVGSSFGLVVPGFIGWIAVASLPDFTGYPFWRLLITIIAAAAGATLWSIFIGYFGGRLVELALKLEVKQ